MIERLAAATVMVGLTIAGRMCALEHDWLQRDPR